MKSKTRGDSNDQNNETKVISNEINITQIKSTRQINQDKMSNYTNNEFPQIKIVPESFDSKSQISHDEWALSGKNSILSRDEVSFNYNKGSP